MAPTSAAGEDAGCIFAARFALRFPRRRRSRSSWGTRSESAGSDRFDGIGGRGRARQKAPADARGRNDSAIQRAAVLNSAGEAGRPARGERRCSAIGPMCSSDFVGSSR